MPYVTAPLRRWHRVLVLMTLGLGIIRCSPISSSSPHLDLSDEEHMLISIQQMENALSPDQRTVFELSLQKLVTALTLQDINRWAGTPASISSLSLLRLDGLTAEEIITKAEGVEP